MPKHDQHSGSDMYYNGSIDVAVDRNYQRIVYIVNGVSEMMYIWEGSEALC